MTKKKSIKKFIEKSEQSLAARYFTLSNTAMLHMVQGGDLDYGYDRANEEIQIECGVSLRDELNDWYDSIVKGDSYCYEEWQKVRAKYVK